MAGANDEKVRKIIAEKLAVEDTEVTSGAALIEDLGADSLDIVELTMEFETAFDIQIPDEDVEKMRTVQDAINYVNSKTGSKS